jgi:hypothetical protein
MLNKNLAVYSEKNIQVNKLSFVAKLLCFNRKANGCIENRPAIYGMNIPERGVSEGQIRYNNIGGVHKLNKVRPSIV